jgi:hypothetical protein
VQIIDLLGRIVAQPLRNTRLSPGEHEITWEATGHPPGIYIVLLSVGNTPAGASKMIVLL